MIYFLIPIIILIIGIIIFITKKVEIKQNKVCLCVVIINIAIICFFRFILPGGSKYGEITIYFWINIIINVFLLIILLNKRIKISVKSTIAIITIYLLLTIFIPTYRLESHEHKYINGNENIQKYIDYFDCYSIKLKRFYK